MPKTSLGSLSAQDLRRYQRRAFLVITNSLNSLLPPLVNIFVSWAVIRTASLALWGAFVDVLIVAQLAAHLIAWGNRDYLLRAFSLNPTFLTRTWQMSLWTRLVLWGGCGLLLAVMGWGFGRWLVVMVWVLALVLYQSHDVLVVYRRAFLSAFWVEVGGTAVLLTTILLTQNSLTLDGLIWLNTLVMWGKTAVFLRLFRQDTLVTRPTFQLDWGYFRLAFPFFLLGFTGMLQSRIDLYSVSYFLPDSEVGRYQVFINLIIYLQALANFIVVPFSKSLYRLDKTAVTKIAIRLFSLGLLIIPLALPVLRWLLHTIYQFNFSWTFMVWGGLSVLPFYFYVPVIYSLYKYNLQRIVIRVSLAGAGINLILNIFLLPRLGLLGAIVATAVMNWLVLLYYWYWMRKPVTRQP